MKTRSDRRRFLRGMGLTGGALVLEHWTDALITRAFGQATGRQIAVMLAVGEGFQADRMYPKEFQVQGDKKNLQTLAAVAPTASFAWPAYLEALQPLRTKSVMVDGAHMGQRKSRPHGVQTAAFSGIVPDTGSGSESAFIGSPETPTLDAILAPELSKGLPVSKLVAGISGVSWRGKLAEQAAVFASRPGKLDTHKTTASGLHAAAFSGGIEGGGSGAGASSFRPRFSDLIAADAQRVMRGLASEERAVLESYIGTVEAYEKNLESRAKAIVNCEVPPKKAQGTPEQEIVNMFETAKVALVCGLTNVFGFAVGYEPGHASIPDFPEVFKGMTNGAYDPHGAYVPRTSEQLNRFMAQQLAGLLAALDAAKDTDGKSLFDKTVVTWVSETGATTGGHHAVPGNPFPVLLLGGHPKLKSGGRFLRYRTGEHYVSEVLSSVAAMFGVTATDLQKNVKSSYKSDLNDILA